MKLTTALCVLTATALLVGPKTTAQAQLPPPAAPFTLWNFLGIPQGFNKIRDATSNRRGNLPGTERKPPLKAIADPKNLESQNPAIAKAAEIKSQEDMTQKIKAIKYLASVGCGCYAGVKEALLAALDDCTEEVRYQTVLAIEDAANQQCDTCGQSCCCDEELTTKLSQIAYERTDKCTWLEPSERVREAAKRAMSACCPGDGGAEEVMPVMEQQPAQPQQEETIPQEPTPPTPADGDNRSARRVPQVGRTPQFHDASSKAIIRDSQTVVSDQGETEEIVTIDFGTNGVRGSRTPSVTSRRSNVPAAPQKPAAPAAKHQTSTAPVAEPRQQAAAPAMGPSSRRAAAERGVGAPVATPAAAVQRVANKPAPAPLKNVRPDYGTLEAKANTNHKTSANGKRRTVQGTVARVNADNGTVEVRVTRGDELVVGDRLQLSRSFLLDHSKVGYVQVVSIDHGAAIARTVDGLSLNKIVRGDEASLVSTSDAPQQAQAPAKVPTLASAK